MSRALTSERLSAAGRLRRFLFEPEGARVALEFTSTAVVGARVESVRGRLEVRSLFREPLTEGAFVPTLESPGFVRKEEIRDATKRVLTRVGAAPAARAALVLPDVVARFRLFAQDEIAVETSKRNALIAFRMQKLLPFPAADVQVVSAWPRAPQSVLGIGCSRSVLGAFEQAGQAFGLDVGSVETSSMALLRGLPSTGDVLLVRHDPAWLTLTLVRDGWPVAVRSFDAAVSRNLGEVRRELASTAVFWRDRLSGERLSGAFVHAEDSWSESLSADVASLFDCDPERSVPPANLSVAGVPAAVSRSAAPGLSLLAAGS